MTVVWLPARSTAVTVNVNGPPTVLVAMQKLEKKGWLTHRANGRAYVYRPVRSRESAQAGLVTEMLDAVFDGDPKLLVTQLLDARPWTGQELAQLRQLIDVRRKEKRHD